MIQIYFNRIKSLVDSYVSASFVVDSTLNFEMRPGEQGYVTGELLFVDGSRLHFREFLDGEDAIIEKLMYTYHYQNALNGLIFRYDNALHRPRLASLEHKHSADGVQLVPAPTLEDVLLEATAYQAL